MRGLTKFLLVCAAVTGVPLILSAQPPGRPIPLIREAIDESKLVTLSHNTHPEAVPANDLGRVPDDFPMEHMLLQLKRSPEREAALQEYISELHDSTSPNYHKWLTPDDFALHFGVADADVEVVRGWLRSHGFTVHGTQPNGMFIDFSGTAAMVKAAYHTEIHSLNVNGESHFANVSDPQIPAALAPAVTGVVSLHNFHPKPALVPRPAYTYTNNNGTFHALSPGDIATIYNLNPLFAAGYCGRGQSIMLLEDSYLYSTGDWTVFRKEFGLYRAYPYGTLSQISPAGALTCVNPGVGLNDNESAIDVEWATAVAPNAAIILAACEDTTASGVLIALLNVLNGPAANLPSVVSSSFLDPEEFLGAAGNAAYYSAYQQAVAEGVSVFVAAGDQDAAQTDRGSAATHGITISGLASTPYNVAVGGTDFGYTADFVSSSTYWNSTNSPTFSSALSYIQEIPWNDSCASGLTANYLAVVDGDPTITPITLCNSTLARDSLLVNAIGGSGGPSACATGIPTIVGVDSGTCAGYPKPAFQSGTFGNPSDGVRDIPDVALFASNGFWGAYYLVCWSDPNGGSPCTGPPSTWAGFGGTSVSAPVMAGIQALVNQYTKSRWGNPNTVYYSLAQGEYGVGGAGAASCNSNTVNKTSNSCIFYDITEGDNDGACRAASDGTLYNCYRPSGTYGILSTSNSSDSPAFTSNVGWDFPTGLGSVNAYNLVMNWP